MGLAIELVYKTNCSIASEYDIMNAEELRLWQNDDLLQSDGLPLSQPLGKLGSEVTSRRWLSGGWSPLKYLVPTSARTMCVRTTPGPENNISWGNVARFQCFNTSRRILKQVAWSGLQTLYRRLSGHWGPACLNGRAVVGASVSVAWVSLERAPDCCKLGRTLQ